MLTKWSDRPARSVKVLVRPSTAKPSTRKSARS